MEHRDTTQKTRRLEVAAEHAGIAFRSKYGLWALASISFIESALVVPLITDPFLVGYILADRTKVTRAVIVTTIASVLGGVVAYVLAFAFYEFIAQQYLVGSVGEQFYAMVSGLQEGTFLVTLLGAVTPIPYTIVAMALGFIEGSIWLFILASFIGRGGRYLIVGYLTYRFGKEAVAIARRHILLCAISIAVLAILYVGLKYM